MTTPSLARSWYCSRDGSGLQIHLPQGREGGAVLQPDHRRHREPFRTLRDHRRHGAAVGHLGSRPPARSRSPCPGAAVSLYADASSSRSPSRWASASASPWESVVKAGALVKRPVGDVPAGQRGGRGEHQHQQDDQPAPPSPPGLPLPLRGQPLGRELTQLGLRRSRGCGVAYGRRRVCGASAGAIGVVHRGGWHELGDFVIGAVGGRKLGDPWDRAGEAAGGRRPPERRARRGRCEAESRGGRRSARGRRAGPAAGRPAPGAPGTRTPWRRAAGVGRRGRWRGRRAHPGTAGSARRSGTPRGAARRRARGRTPPGSGCRRCAACGR